MPVQLMSCRYESLTHCLMGYQKTGVHLIGFNGQELVPGFIADDFGLYYIIPKLVTSFGISLDTALPLFFYGLSGLSFLIGLTGFFFLYRLWLERLVAFTGLALLIYLNTRFRDVYQLYTVTALTCIPWILYFAQRKIKLSFFIFSFLAGMFIGTAHYIRMHSGTAVLIFFCILVVTYVKDSWWKKVALMSCLFFGLSLAVLHFRSVFHAYTVCAEQHFPKESKQCQSHHQIWHSLYIGFGFLNSPFGIQYDDSVAHKKVMAIDPTISVTDPYPSPASEKILRSELFSLFKRQPIFVIHTIFAKLGILLFYFLLFANFGVVASFFYPLPWQIRLAFLGALCFNSLFVILVMPFFYYMLGFFTCSTLFGIASINNALEHWWHKKKK
jgi:hypothetical protein